jgi:uncharacterized protein (DUF934 family)
MATADRAIKARKKASPDRIQADIRNPKVIRNQAIEANDFLHIAETDDLDVTQLPAGNISVPLNVWLENKDALLARDGVTAVQIASDEDPKEVADDLHQIPMIVLPFVMFVDGRGYSHANNLRLRYHYQKEIRAIGDVHFDHLGFLARVGVDAFELPAKDDHEYALRAFTEFSEVYQPAADGKPLVFSRRRVKH